jgi:hypothetical protein
MISSRISPQQISPGAALRRTNDPVNDPAVIESVHKEEPMHLICGFCGIRAEDSEMLLQSQTHQGTFICSWCVESTMPAIAKYRRNHGWKRQAPPTTQPQQ